MYVDGAVGRLCQHFALYLQCLGILTLEEVHALTGERVGLVRLTVEPCAAVVVIELLALGVFELIATQPLAALEQLVDVARLFTAHVKGYP